MFMIGLSGIHTGAMVVDAVAYRSQSTQQVIAVATENRNAGVVSVKALVNLEVCRRQPVIAEFVRDAAAGRRKKSKIPISLRLSSLLQASLGRPPGVASARPVPLVISGP